MVEPALTSTAVVSLEKRSSTVGTVGVATHHEETQVHPKATLTTRTMVSTLVVYYMYRSYILALFLI